MEGMERSLLQSSLHLPLPRVADAATLPGMQRWMILLAFALAVGLPKVCPGATEEEIVAAIGRLGSATYAERQEAATMLVGLGDKAVAPLERAARSKDPEIRLRAVEILKEIEERARALPPIPEDVREQFAGKDPPNRKQVIKDLLGKGPESYRTVYGLLMSEGGEEEREAILSSLAEAGVRPHDLALGGEWGIKLLGVYLGRQLTTSLRCQSYAAWSLITGSVSNDIAKLSARPVEQLEDEEAAGLVWLHFANDDAKAAHALARLRKVRTPPPDLDIEAGDAELFDLRIEAMVASPSPRRLAAMATHCRVMERPETFDAAVKALESVAGIAATTRHENTTTDEIMVDALLVSDRPQTALECLVKRRSYALAFEFCRARGSYADALGIVDKARERETKLPADLEGAAERLRDFHDTFELEAELKALREGRDGTNALPAIRGIVLTYLVRGQPDKAKEFSRRMSVELDASPEDIALGLSVEAALMWSWFERLHPSESGRRRLERVIDHVGTPQKAKEFLPALVKMMEAADAEPDDMASRRQCWRVGLLCLRMLPGVEMMDVVAFETAPQSKAEPLVCLGALAAANGDWKTAATWFKRAMDNQRYHPSARYLYGKALTKLGRREEGEQYLRQGSLLPLASHHARCELLRVLLLYGFHEDAVAQWDVARRTGCFASSWRPAGFRFAQRLLREEKSPEVRQRLLQFMRIHEGAKGYGDVSERLHDAAEYRCTLAAEAAESGKLDEAVALYERAWELSMLNVDLFADGIRLLHEANREADAERLYKRTVAVLRENSRLFPDCAHCRNVLAWFMARCHRELEAARKHAETAVRLQPRASAYVDTLAEIMFHLGDREKAVELQQKAVQYAPNMRELHERLEGFRKDPIPTGPR